MVDLVLDQEPSRVIDGGAGSGRFLAEVLRRQPRTDAIAVDTDPVATLMTRAMLAVKKASSIRVVNGDYTKLDLPKITGRLRSSGTRPTCASSVERRGEGLGAGYRTAIGYK